MGLFVIVALMFVGSLFAFRGAEFQAEGTALLESAKALLA
ncbi:hypothetical protein HMSSN036_59850 [Paenibacillus macerans]|nr:hypothetical protein HMSSN036_59850 [Paenibacillus macerans]